MILAFSSSYGLKYSLVSLGSLLNVFTLSDIVSGLKPELLHMILLMG